MRAGTLSPAVAPAGDRSEAPHRRPLNVDAAVGAAAVVVGAATAIAGGVLKRGSLDMLPCLDGVFVGGVIAALLFLGQGHRPRFTPLVVAPIIALGAVGFFLLHSRPLAPLGLQIALVGVVVMAAARARAA